MSATINVQMSLVELAAIIRAIEEVGIADEALETVYRRLEQYRELEINNALRALGPDAA